MSASSTRERGGDVPCYTNQQGSSYPGVRAGRLVNAAIVTWHIARGGTKIFGIDTTLFVEQVPSGTPSAGVIDCGCVASSHILGHISEVEKPPNNFEIFLKRVRSSHSNYIRLVAARFKNTMLLTQENHVP